MTFPTTRCEDALPCSPPRPPTPSACTTPSTAASPTCGALVHSLGDSDRRRAQAIATWFDGFAVELRAHLQSVAELVIPTIARRREQQADELAETVADHHCAVDEAIDDLSVALARLASRVQPWAFNHDRAIDAVHRLEAATHRSSAVEADHVLPVMALLHPSELYDIEVRTAR